MSRDEAAIIANALEHLVTSKKQAKLSCEPIEKLARKYRAISSQLTTSEERLLSQNAKQARGALKGVVG